MFARIESFVQIMVSSIRPIVFARNPYFCTQMNERNNIREINEISEIQLF